MNNFSGSFAGDHSSVISLDYVTNNFPGVVGYPYCVVQDENGNIVPNISGCAAALAFMKDKCTDA
jgi:hypothetical protein